MRRTGAKISLWDAAIRAVAFATTPAERQRLANLYERNLGVKASAVLAQAEAIRVKESP